MSGVSIHVDDDPGADELMALYGSVEWIAYTRDPDGLGAAVRNSTFVVTARETGLASWARGHGQETSHVGEGGYLAICQLQFVATMLAAISWSKDTLPTVGTDSHEVTATVRTNGCRSHKLKSAVGTSKGQGQITGRAGLRLLIHRCSTTRTDSLAAHGTKPILHEHLAVTAGAADGLQSSCL